MEEFENESHVEKKLDYIIHELETQHKKIQTIHRILVVDKIFRFIYWFVIIGVSIGAFYYMQPYIETLLNTYNQVSNIANPIQNLQDSLMPR